MLELAFIACSLLEGQTCKDVKLTYASESISVHGCFLYGQHEIARWQDGHPNWQVRGWKCRPAGLVAKA
jgi:hypothetical protein